MYKWRVTIRYEPGKGIMLDQAKGYRSHTVFCCFMAALAVGFHQTTLIGAKKVPEFGSKLGIPAAADETAFRRTPGLVPIVWVQSLGLPTAL